MITSPHRPSFSWHLRTRTLPLGPRTLLMAILNVTPDSFSDGNRFLLPAQALTQALTCLDQGADILDLGGESTRPHATPITPDEEQSRILPVLQAILKSRPDTILSVDTYHAATALAAIQAGVEIINDVSGLTWDPKMAAVLAEHRPGCILMHTRGKPQEWSTLPALAPETILPLVLEGLKASLAQAAAAGIPLDSIVLDPGFGFGKRGAENMTLHAGLAQLHTLARPILAGTSRKRFLTAGLGTQVQGTQVQGTQVRGTPTDQDRQHATTASNTAAILAGAHLLRVHDIPAARAAANVADAILKA